MKETRDQTWGELHETLDETADSAKLSLEVAADELSDEAQRYITKARRMGAKCSGLWLVTRTRNDRWGFELAWVRLQVVDEETNPNLLLRIEAGRAKAFTKRVAMLQGIRVRARTFDNVEMQHREVLRDFKDRAAKIRAALKDWQQARAVGLKYGAAGIHDLGFETGRITESDWTLSR
jgi:hypothetical protein